MISSLNIIDTTMRVEIECPAALDQDTCPTRKTAVATIVGKVILSLGSDAGSRAGQLRVLPWIERLVTAASEFGSDAGFDST
jgi:hypothetical protein